MQREWIGRSEGAEIDFPIEGSAEKLTVFTTRPDTLYGATFMVIAPEHALVATLTTPDRRRAVEDYARAAAAKSELERTDLAKEKSGVFTGAYARNPAFEPGDARGRIPIYVADYVLAHYGTGAIMAVPGQDQRDWDFATAHRPADRAHGPAAGRLRWPGLTQAMARRSRARAGTVAASPRRSRRRSRGSTRADRDARASPIVCATGCSRASVTGASRSRSGTSATGRTRACPTSSYPWSCRRWPTSLQRRTALRRSPGRASGSRRPIRARASQCGARPTRCRAGPARAGTTCASWIRRTTARRSRRRPCATGGPSICTSAAPSTLSCTSCTPASGTRCSSTRVSSRPRSHSRSSSIKVCSRLLPTRTRAGARWRSTRSTRARTHPCCARPASP